MGTVSEPEEYIAHVLEPDGVTPTRFVRDGARWTNAETIAIPVGGTLDLGNGWTLSNPEPLFADPSATFGVEGDEDDDV